LLIRGAELFIASIELAARIVDRPFVPTVLGAIEPGQLGIALTHEHVYVDWPWAIGAASVRDESPEVLNVVVERLERARAAGVAALVDVGASAGPSPEFLRQAAERTSLHVLASTGCFAPEMTPLPAWAYPPANRDTIAAHLISEATEGLLGSGVLPAVIKVATGARAISELEETILLAAALAQRETGLAITTHTTRTKQAVEQVETLAAGGADLSRVAIGHIGWGTGPDDAEFHRELARMGVFLGLDMVGLPAATIEQWTRMVLDLVEAGHARQILLSHDNCGHQRGLAEVFGEEWVTGDFGVIQRELVPRLREAGLTDDLLDLVLIDNPRRLLTVGSPRR
jgi:phosphotriesterase-related protein